MNIITKKFRSPVLIMGILLLTIPVLINGTELKKSGFSKVDQNVAAKISRIRIPFIKNQGQIDEEVAFYAQIKNGKISVLRNGSIYYSIFKKTSEDKIEGIVFEELFENAIIKKISGIDRTTNNVSYFKGSNKNNHKSKISTFNRLDYGKVFKGIGVKLTANGNNVEKWFYVYPGAKTDDIIMRLKGIKKLNINRAGELEVFTESGVIALTKPIAFQKNGDKKIPVKVSYVLKGNTYGFAVGNYDKTKMLIIDPQIVSTFVGGNSDDALYETSIASDSEGNIFVSGYTYSTDFPTTSGSFSESFLGGTSDRFVSKFDKDLTTLLASTFIGGSGDEFGVGIDIDENGIVFISGYTNSNDFPVTSGTYKSTLTGGRDVFVAKLSNDLAVLHAATYLGGSDDEAKMFPRIDMKVGKSGAVYITGLTLSADFPVSNNAFDKVFGGGISVGDFFVSKFDNELKVLMGSTYLGGVGDEWRPSIVLDAEENVFVCGETYSNNYPVTIDAYDITSEGVGDITISKFSSDLSVLKASTLFGGNGNDEEPLAMVINEDGEIYITGYTSASNFPVTSEVYDSGQLKGTRDGYVAKFDNSLSTLLASTLIGGNGMDSGRGIIIDSFGNVIITGNTDSVDFPVTDNANDITFNSTVSGTGDAFVSKLKGDLTSLIASTFIGGISEDAGFRLTEGILGNIFISGYTFSSNFPTSENTFDHFHNSGRDCFIARVDKKLSPFPSELSINFEVKKSEIRGWIIKKEIAQISVSMPDLSNVSFSKVLLFQNVKEDNTFALMQEIESSELINGRVFLTNQIIEKDKSYTYTAEVIDDSGRVIGRSKKNI